MKLYSNLYTVVIFLVTVGIFYHLPSEDVSTQVIIEEKEEGILDSADELSRINNKNIASLCTQLSKKTVQTIVGDNPKNSLTSISQNLDALEIIIHNVAIIAQLSLIYTSATNKTVKTTLVITDQEFDVDTYNNAITRALDWALVAVYTPSLTNTLAAQSALSTAIIYFDVILDHANSLLVLSLYSIAEINNALGQLHSQLAYLQLLQSV